RAGHVLDRLEEGDGAVVILDQVARVVEASRGPGDLAAEEVREVVAIGGCGARVLEVDRARTRPGFAEHAPVVGGVANPLLAVLVARADLQPADKRILAEFVTEVGPDRMLLAGAVLDVIHRRAPELEAGIGEVL